MWESNEELFDTKEEAKRAAIERVKQINEYQHKKDEVWVQRNDFIPLWLIHLFRETPLRILFYKRVF